jgi:hypothetical protein
LGDDVLVRHRHYRHPHPCQAGDLGGEHPATVDDDLALDVTVVGPDPMNPSALEVDAQHSGSLVDRHATHAGQRRQRITQQGRVDVAVGR